MGKVLSIEEYKNKKFEKKYIEQYIKLFGYVEQQNKREEVKNAKDISNN